MGARRKSCMRWTGWPVVRLRLARAAEAEFSQQAMMVISRSTWWTLAIFTWVFPFVAGLAFTASQVSIVNPSDVGARGRTLVSDEDAATGSATRQQVFSV